MYLKGVADVAKSEIIIYKCLMCNHEQLIQNGIDGRWCERCNGHIVPVGKKKKTFKGGEADEAN